jgi:hypothetical protein
MGVGHLHGGNLREGKLHMGTCRFQMDMTG